MKNSDIPVGTKIYYTGDMANNDGFGVITKYIENRWGEFVNITMEDGRKIIHLSAVSFSQEYQGNGLTRFVTLEAYNKYRLLLNTSNGINYSRKEHK